MLNILFMGRPFKIYGRIVSLVEIFMVDVRQIFRVWNKGYGDQTGDHKCLLFPVLAKNKVAVPVLVRYADKNSSAPKRFHLSAFVGNEAVQTSYPAKIGNLVQSFVTKDWFPSLTSNISHLLPPFGNGSYHQMADDAMVRR